MSDLVDAVVAAARAKAYSEVLELIDTEIARYKAADQDWKDLDLLDTLRAKVKAAGESTSP